MFGRKEKKGMQSHTIETPDIGILNNLILSYQKDIMARGTFIHSTIFYNPANENWTGVVFYYL